MPALFLRTNVPVDVLLTSEILEEASQVVANILRKPEKSVMVLLEDNVAMRLSEGEEPAASGQLVSIGGLGEEQNKALAGAISGVLEAKLCIPNLRFQMFFQDVKQEPCSENVCCLHIIHQ